MTNVDYDLTVAGFNGFLAKTKGRDLVGKFAQYFCRGLAGISKSNLPQHHKNFQAVFVRIMEARRTTRWLMCMNTYLGFAKPCPWRNEILFRSNQTGLLWWQVLDQLRWLQEIKVVAGDPKQMKRISFVGFVLASVFGVLNFLNEFVNAQNPLKKSKAKTQLLKHLLSLICTLHISEIYKTHEGICGFTGAAVALIDIRSIYPTRSKIE